MSCFLSYFIIKPQLQLEGYTSDSSCFLSYFIIKPQLRSILQCRIEVVSYLISSSNHNRSSIPRNGALRCFLSYFIIKPQRLSVAKVKRYSCFLSYFIIKPQPIWRILLVFNGLEYRLHIRSGMMSIKS